MGKIQEMTKELQLKFAEFSAAMAEARIPFGLGEVLRTRERQLAYAAQGRDRDELVKILTEYKWFHTLEKVRCLHALNKTPLEICQILRKEAGLAPLHPKDWYQITWTLNSRHFPDPTGHARAFDVHLFISGKTPTWDTKWDGDNDGVPEYLEAARIGRVVGLDAGGLWKKRPDYPHFQLV